MKYSLIILQLALLLIFIPKGPVFAFGDNDFIVKIDPPYPSANQNITITITSYAFDVSQSLFSWKKDGGQVLSGEGQNELYTQTGPVGNTATIDLEITTPANTVYTKTITLPSAEIDLLVEGQTYTPYWFKGRPLVTEGNNVTVTAIPTIVDSEGKNYSSNNLIYNWTLNGVRMLAQSGINKTSFIFNKKNKFLKDEVTVIVQTKDQSITTANTVIIGSSRPTLEMYEVKSILGIQFSKAITDILKTSSDEFKTIAEPFYFNKQSVLDKNIKFDVDIKTPGNIIHKEGTDREIGLLKDQNLNYSDFTMDIEALNQNRSSESDKKEWTVNINNTIPTI